MALPLTIIFCFLVGIKADLSLEDDEIDPKDAFFRHLRSFDQTQENNEEFFYNIPKPGGLSTEDHLRLQFEPNRNEDSRNKRSYHVLPSPGLKSHFQIDSADKHRSKRDVGTTEKTLTTLNEELDVEETTILENEETPQDLIINDFIRFKREENNVKIKSENDSQTSRTKREPEIRKEKMVMERSFADSGNEREPRGPTKDQWIKQPYPVERPIEDNIPSASDNIRAPRVHFVTQRRPGQVQNQPDRQDNRQPASSPPQQPPLPPPPPPPPPPPAFSPRMHEDREGRARDFEPYPHHMLPQPYYPYPRPRSFDPYRPRYYDPYYDRFDDRRFSFDPYDPRFKYEEHDDRLMQPVPPVVSPNKQRRIIYYATLPEVVRSPQNNDRFRYRYQDIYDDRFGSPVTSIPGPNAGSSGVVDHYRIRKPYNNQLQKQRDYDRTNTDRKKTPLYPVKVSTDVNVREPKKNPERRIYSEVDRRYPYKTSSFQTAEEANY